jgi:hypothetical protein
VAAAALEVEELVVVDVVAEAEAEEEVVWVAAGHLAVEEEVGLAEEEEEDPLEAEAEAVAAFNLFPRTSVLLATCQTFIHFKVNIYIHKQNKNVFHNRV